MCSRRVWDSNPGRSSSPRCSFQDYRNQPLCQLSMADGVGFEPTMPFGILALEASAFSQTLPTIHVKLSSPSLFAMPERRRVEAELVVVLPSEGFEPSIHKAADFLTALCRHSRCCHRCCPDYVFAICSTKHLGGRCIVSTHLRNELIASI